LTNINCPFYWTDEESVCEKLAVTTPAVTTPYVVEVVSAALIP